MDIHDSQQSFTMTSLASISVGQQVMDSRKKCNSSFFCTTGSRSRRTASRMAAA